MGGMTLPDWSFLRGFALGLLAIEHMCRENTRYIYLLHINWKIAVRINLPSSFSLVHKTVVMQIKEAWCKSKLSRVEVSIDKFGFVLIFCG